MNKRNWLIAIVGALLLIGCCCVVAAAGIVILDPFEWNLLDRLSGKGDPTVKVMPPETSLYMGVNLLNATPDKLNRVMQPFADVSAGEVKNWEETRAELDQQLLDELGVTFAEDIQPWIGQYLSLGISSLELDGYGELKNAHFVLALETRNTQKADLFLAKVKAKLSEDSANTIEESEYQGVKLTSVTSAAGSSAASLPDSTVFGRAGSTLLLGMQIEDLQKAIDTQKGSASLASNPNYQKMLQSLPSGRLLTAYLDMQQFTEMYMGLLENMSASLGTSMTPEQIQELKDYMQSSSAGTQGMGLSIMIVDAGVQLDSITNYEPEKLSGEQKVIVEQTGVATKVVELLPEDTFLYLGRKLPSAFWTMLPGVFVKTGSVTQDELDQAMLQFEQQIGFNPVTDLLPYLEGETALAAFPSSDGLIPAQSGLNVGAALLLESSNPDGMLSLLKDVTVATAPMGLIFNEQQAGDLTYYELQDPGSGISMVAMGVNNPYLALSTSGKTLQALFAGNPSLAKSASYQQSIAALPEGMAPFLYLDVASLTGVIRESLPADDLQVFNTSIQMFEPIPTILGGASLERGESVRSTMIVFITPLQK